MAKDCGSEQVVATLTPFVQPQKSRGERGNKERSLLSYLKPDKLNFHACLELKIAFFSACFMFIRLSRGIRSLEKAWSKITIDFFFEVTISFILKFQKTSREGTRFLNTHQEGVQGWKAEKSHKRVCFCWGQAPHTHVPLQRTQEKWAGVTFPHHSSCKSNKESPSCIKGSLSSSWFYVLFVIFSVNPAGAQLNLINTY